MDKKNMKVAVYFRTATVPIEQKSLALRQLQELRASRVERFERGGHETYGPAKWPCGCRGFY